MSLKNWLTKSKLSTAVKKTIEDCSIPHELVLNFDQTGIKIVPSGDWTLDKEGKFIALFIKSYNPVFIKMLHY